MIKPIYAPWSVYISLAVEQKGMWAIYVANHLEYDNEKENKLWNEFMLKAHKILDNSFEVINDMMFGGLFFFETETEMRQVFSLFTEAPIDSSALYACTYNPKGVCLSENT